MRSVSQLVSHRPGSQTPSPESKAFEKGEPQIITDEIGRGTIYSQAQSPFKPPVRVNRLNLEKLNL